MTLIATPCRLSTSRDAISDNGMIVALISATRHSYRKKSRMITTRTAPTSSDSVRLLIEVSMKVAGRKMVVSISMPFNPGRISLIASSTPLVTSRVFAQGSFSTISINPSPWLMTASPKSGQVSQTTSATSLMSRGDPSAFVRSLMGTSPNFSGVMRGKTERTPSR